MTGFSLFRIVSLAFGPLFWRGLGGGRIRALPAELPSLATRSLPVSRILPLAPTLELVAEYRIRDLLVGAPGIVGTVDDRLEASGVLLKNNRFFVIFDNSPHIARLGNPLAVGHPDNALLRQRGESAGFEDLTFHERWDRFLIIIEAVAFGENLFKPRIEEYDQDFRYLDSAWVDFPLYSDNKGLEGLTYVSRGDEDFVLGLCEGNRCRGGAAGRKPGGGRVQILRKASDHWEHRGTIKLPKSVPFEDYASLDIVEDRIAVVSQMTSALWIGRFHPGTWDFVDEGRVLWFPRSPKGKILYGNVEGVAWITPTQLAFVSDKIKTGEQPKRCAKKDQSIHVFNLPNVPGSEGSQNGSCGSGD